MPVVTIIGLPLRSVAVRMRWRQLFKRFCFRPATDCTGICFLSFSVRSWLHCHCSAVPCMGGCATLFSTGTFMPVVTIIGLPLRSVAVRMRWRQLFKRFCFRPATDCTGICFFSLSVRSRLHCHRSAVPCMGGCTALFSAGTFMPVIVTVKFPLRSVAVLMRFR